MEQGDVRANQIPDHVQGLRAAQQGIQSGADQLAVHQLPRVFILPGDMRCQLLGYAWMPVKVSSSAKWQAVQ